MSAAELERIAQESQRLAVGMRQSAKRLHKLGQAAAKVIGGTASGADMKMMNQASTAAARADRAAAAFEQAAQEATKAALREREREAVRKQQARQKQELRR